jgi:tol-pal system protein YbgF
MRLAACLLLACALPAAAQQDNSETLADIRQQLSVLNTELRGLQRELATTGAAALGIEGTSFPDRVASLEAQLQELTARTERLSFRVESVARDGTARIEDLRFQLCELTPDCDLATLPQPGPLGGEVAAPAAPAAPAPAAPGPVRRPDAPAAELAVGEQGEFDAARGLLDQGRAAEAADAFERFLTAYPTGPLTSEAQFLRAEALAGSGQSAEAARAYLETFSGTPDGPRAPEALLGLGRALAQIGQREEACLTLDEVAIRFPDAAAAATARSERAGLGCT